MAVAPGLRPPTVETDDSCGEPVDPHTVSLERSVAVVVVFSLSDASSSPTLLVFPSTTTEFWAEHVAAGDGRVLFVVVVAGGDGGAGRILEDVVVLGGPLRMSDHFSQRRGGGEGPLPRPPPAAVGGAFSAVICSNVGGTGSVGGTNGCVCSIGGIFGPVFSAIVGPTSSGT